MPTPPTLSDVVDLLHGWYPPATADSWDAVGLVAGDPGQQVAKVMFAVDPAPAVAEEAASWGADLLVVHHPLFLKPVHGVARTTPKARTLGVLTDAGCALLTAHTNADQALGGVSEALATTLGLRDLAPVLPRAAAVAAMLATHPYDEAYDVAEVAPATRGDTGSGRIGDVEPTTLEAFARLVAERLPSTAGGVRVGGDPQRPVRRVAVCGGAGDFMLDAVLATDADVYVTSDLRHHPASEFLEQGGPALVDVAHWAAEWTWLPVVQARLGAVLGDTVETRVSEIPTDPWTSVRTQS